MRTRIKSLCVYVYQARRITHNGQMLKYSVFKPRSFNCIMSYGNLPQDCNPAEFRHQTTFALMNSKDNTVEWNEMFSIGQIYSLDSTFSIRMFLDTTFLALGTTTKVGKLSIPLRELIARGAIDRPVTGWHLLKCGEYTVELELNFQFATVQKTAEHKMAEQLEADLAEMMSRTNV